MGKYIYCIVENRDHPQFTSKNIGKEYSPVYTLKYKDIGAVISESPITKYSFISDNYIAHQKVIEESQSYNLNPLPVRFCTIANNEESICAILDKRYEDFQANLKQMQGKYELGLKVFWKDNIAYDEILLNNPSIQAERDRLKSMDPEKTYFLRIRVGELVEKAITEKREREMQEFINRFQNICYDLSMGRIIGDKMIFNAAFLVDRGQEKLLDEEVNRIAFDNESRLKIKYVGPVPPYNFVEITINTNELGLN